MKKQMIRFYFRPDNIMNVELEAEVESPLSEQYYSIRNIHSANSSQKTPILPDTFLKCILRSNHRVWVHTDSDLPSDLGSSMGAYLEQILPAIKISKSKTFGNY